MLMMLLMKLTRGLIPVAEIYRVHVTNHAKEQIKNISDYIIGKYKSSVAAKNISRHLRSSIKSLAFMPSRIAFVTEEPWRSYGFHKMVDGSYLIYFWIDEDRRMVIVTAVVNGRMEQFFQLEKMDFM